jgi:hypothetical protein
VCVVFGGHPLRTATASARASKVPAGVGIHFCFCMLSSITHIKRQQMKRRVHMLEENPAKGTYILDPQQTRKRTEDASVCVKSFYLSITNKCHANSVRMLVGRCNCVIRQNELLEKLCPCYEGPSKAVPRNVASAADREFVTSSRSPPNKHFST